MFPYLFIVYLFTYFIVKHHFSPQVHRLFRTCICILYFLSHFHTCTRRDDSKQTSDKEEPSICLTRNLLQVFLSWTMPGGGADGTGWQSGCDPSSPEHTTGQQAMVQGRVTQEIRSVSLWFTLYITVHMWWWWSVGWLKNFPSYNSLIS